MNHGTSVVYVSFGVERLSFEWIPLESPIVIVHNDDLLLDSEPRPGVRHVHGHGNIGFGAAVNLALPLLESRRVILCNPDTRLSRAHWAPLANASENEVVSIPLLDATGAPTAVASPYPSPLTSLLTGLRVGRYIKRGTMARRLLQQLLGAEGQGHADSGLPTVRPLDRAWCSGTVFSVDVQRLLAVGGFDPGFFLYFEDMDLCRRLAARFPDMVVRVADVQAGHHDVGGSARTGDIRSQVDRHYVASALRASQEMSGMGWSITRTLLQLRLRSMDRG